MGLSSAQQKRLFFFDKIDAKINCTTKERKELLLTESMYIIYSGKGYDLKFKNLGGGIWQMYAEPHNYSTKEKA